MTAVRSKMTPWAYEGRASDNRRPYLSRKRGAGQPLECFAIFRGGLLDDFRGKRGPGGVLSQSSVSR